MITRGSAPDPGSVARGDSCAPLRFLAAHVAVRLRGPWQLT